MIELHQQRRPLDLPVLRMHGLVKVQAACVAAFAGFP